LRLAQDCGRPAQDSPPWSSPRRLDVHLRAGGLQSGQDAQSGRGRGLIAPTARKGPKGTLLKALNNCETLGQTLTTNNSPLIDRPAVAEIAAPSRNSLNPALFPQPASESLGVLGKVCVVV